MCLLTHIHIRMCICVCVRVCVCIYICLFTRTHPSACDAQTHTYTCDSVRARVCVFVRRCESMCVRRVEYGCEKSTLGVRRVDWVSMCVEDYIGCQSQKKSRKKREGDMRAGE